MTKQQKADARYEAYLVARDAQPVSAEQQAERDRQNAAAEAFKNSAAAVEARVAVDAQRAKQAAEAEAAEAAKNVKPVKDFSGKVMACVGTYHVGDTIIIGSTAHIVSGIGRAFRADEGMDFGHTENVNYVYYN